MWISVLTHLFILSCLFLPAQSISQQSVSREVIESIIESIASDAEESLDQNQMLVWYDQLSFYYEHPLVINKADKDELSELPVWTEREIQAFLRYRNALGPLISIYELQAIPGLNIETLYRLIPFVTVDEEVGKYHVPFQVMLLDGEDEISMRWQRGLELSKGYKQREDSLPPAFLGDPNRYYLRYRHTYSNRLSYGIVLEKDPGELLTFDGQAGFDFTSFHFYARDLNKWFKHLAIGDYNVSLGQGLIQHSGFGRGKNSFITQIKKGGRVIRPSASVNETDFLRGAAFTGEFRPGLEWTIFGSIRTIDGNIAFDPIDTTGIFEFFTSIQESGLHRTESERADRKQVKHKVIGSRLEKSFSGGHLSLNAMYNNFSPEFQRRASLYNRYYFNGQRLLNFSLDYSWIQDNVHMFGEIANSDQGGMAIIQGAIITLHPRLDLAIHFRTFDRDYQAIRPNPFSETSGARNETGLYAGSIIRFGSRWKLGLYADFWKHPWLRFNVDGPSTGREFFARLDFRKKRQMEGYFQYRYEMKERNSSSESIEQHLVPQIRQQIRAQFNRILKPFELRNRLEWSIYSIEGKTENGVLLLQDVIYKPLASPFSFTSRIAFFDTDSYSSRVYAYENDLIYTFSIPPYYRKGVRYYINCRYKGIRDLTLEARFARTTLLHDNSFGTGYDEIESRHDSEVKFQLIYRW